MTRVTKILVIFALDSWHGGLPDLTSELANECFGRPSWQESSAKITNIFVTRVIFDLLFTFRVTIWKKNNFETGKIFYFLDRRSKPDLAISLALCQRVLLRCVSHSLDDDINKQWISTNHRTAHTCLARAQMRVSRNGVNIWVKNVLHNQLQLLWIRVLHNQYWKIKRKTVM